MIIRATNRPLYARLNNTLCLSPALIATLHDTDRISEAIDTALKKMFG